MALAPHKGADDTPSRLFNCACRCLCVPTCTFCASLPEGPVKALSCHYASGCLCVASQQSPIVSSTPSPPQLLVTATSERLRNRTPPAAAATRCRQPFRHNRWSRARPGLCARSRTCVWVFWRRAGGEGEDDERGFGGRQFCWKCVDGSIKLSDRNEMTLRARDKVWSWGHLSTSFFFEKQHRGT